jgi:hypothetical protein
LPITADLKCTPLAESITKRQQCHQIPDEPGLFSVVLRPPFSARPRDAIIDRDACALLVAPGRPVQNRGHASGRPSWARCCLDSQSATTYALSPCGCGARLRELGLTTRGENDVRVEPKQSAFAYMLLSFLPIHLASLETLLVFFLTKTPATCIGV